MNNFIASIALGTLIFVPFSAFAGPIIRTGESVSIDATQSLKGDFYGFGSSVILSGDSENDAYIAGDSNHQCSCQSGSDHSWWRGAGAW